MLRYASWQVQVCVLKKHVNKHIHFVIQIDRALSFNFLLSFCRFLIIGCFYLQFMISSFFFFKKYISSKGAEFQSRCWIAYMWKFIKDLQKWVVNFALCGGFFFVVQVYILYLNTLKFNLNGFDKISSLQSFLSLSSWEN